MLFDRPDGSFKFIVYYNSVTIHVNGSVSVVTHKLIELNKSCMDAILKVLSTAMKENRRNKVLSFTEQLKMREYSKDTLFSLKHYSHVIFISTFAPNLTSCILNVVDKQLTVTSKQHINVTQMFLCLT